MHVLIVLVFNFKLDFALILVSTAAVIIRDATLLLNHNTGLVFPIILMK